MTNLRPRLPLCATDGYLQGSTAVPRRQLQQAKAWACEKGSTAQPNASCAVRSKTTRPSYRAG
eukprot:3762187-Lingulodinium_polyedra.AAC.1